MSLPMAGDETTGRAALRLRPDTSKRPAARTAARRGQLFPSWVYPTAAIVLMLVGWHLAVVVFAMPGYLLPRPLAVLSRAIADAPYLAIHGFVTTYETLGGFA